MSVVRFHGVWHSLSSQVHSKLLSELEHVSSDTVVEMPALALKIELASPMSKLVVTDQDEQLLDPSTWPDVQLLVVLQSKSVSVLTQARSTLSLRTVKMSVLGARGLVVCREGQGRKGG